jgi:peptidyl-prolyl cis-trans isomerase C
LTALLTKARGLRHDKLVMKLMKTCFLFAAVATATFGQILSFGQAAGPATAAAPTQMSSDTVIATIAGISVTVADVRKIMQSAPQNLAQQFKQNPQMALGQVYLMRYLASEGEKAKLDQQSPLKEEIEELIALLKQQVLANAMVNQEMNGYTVTGDQIDDFFKKNQARWQEAKIKIILLGFKPAPLASAKVGPEASPAPGGAAPTIEEKLAAAAENAVQTARPLNERSEAEAQKLAAELVKQLRGGADFAKLVAQYSDDAESKPTGGDFGTPIKTTSSFAQDLKKTVFAMKPGDISDPVRQGNGLYIIRLESITVPPINDVRESIVKEIRDTHMNDYMNDLTKRFTPQVQRPEFFVQPDKYLSQQPK